MDHSSSNLVQSILDRLQVLEAENSSLRQKNPSSNYEPKIALPEKFNGDRRNFRGFINQVDLVFMLNPQRYASDPLKVGVIGTLLCEKALIWFSPYLERQDPILNDYTAFRALLSTTFDEADRSIISAAKLRKLYQGSQPMVTYASDFRLLASSLDWNDSALISQFRYGLNDNVKDLLLHYDSPATLDEIVNLAIQLDNRITEHRQEMSNRPRDFQQRKTPQQTTYCQPTPVPMEINVIHRGPLTSQEKEYRRINNLCLYCGSKDHFRRDCPSASKKPTRSQNIDQLKAKSQ